MTASNFTRPAVTSLSRRFNTRNVSSIGRYLIENDAYLETILNEPTLISNVGSQSDSVRSGQIGNVQGFKVQLYSQLPANGQSLAGFADTVNGLVVAARVRDMPKAGEIPGTVKNVTEPKTGLTPQERTWYDMKLGMDYRTFTLVYGVAVGNAAIIERLNAAACRTSARAARSSDRWSKIRNSVA